MITSYDDMPFGVYIRILDILEDRDRSELDQQVAIVAALCRMTEQAVLDLPVPDFAERAHALGFLETPVPRTVPETVPPSIILGALQLDILTDPAAMNTAQFVDYQQFARMGHAGLPGIIALMLIPPGKVYGHSGKGDSLAYDVEAVRRAVAEHMTVTQVNELAAFFTKAWTTSLRSSLTSLREAVEQVTDPGRKEELMERIREAEVLQAEADSWSAGDGLTP